MLRQNFLQTKLNRGESVIGTWAVIPSVVSADVIATTGIDFLVIDGEHGPTAFETGQAMVIACESRGVSPVVRVGGLIEADILRALDIGAHCIHVPNVNSVQQARDVVDCAKYPPAGSRGFSPFTRAGGYSAYNGARLTAEANCRTLLCIHIEGQDAVADIESFLSVDGIDIVFVGLYDLSKSMGAPGEVDSPRVRDGLRACVTAILGAGKVPGTIANSPAQLRAMVELGVRYVTYSVDCEMLGRAYRDAVADFAAITARSGN